MIKSFKYAFCGFFECIKSQRNMRIHISVAFYVVLAAIITKASLTEWGVLLLCIALVMGGELINTSIEKLCDEMHPDYSKKIGMAKDMAAGAVLVCAIFSAIVGGIIFFNAAKITLALEFAKENSLVAVIIVLLIPLFIKFIIGSKKK